jgi:Holliday junction DNA helicase RuvB
MDEAKGAVHVGQFEYAGERSHILEADILSSDDSKVKGVEFMKEGDIELLKQIAEVEDNIDPDSLMARLGWRSRDVGIWPVILTKLRMGGYVEDVYESNSYHGYRLTEAARALISGTSLPNRAVRPQDGKLSLPDDTFEDIIGHDEIKELLRASLLAEKPVHVLLAGPPALAKTLFLWDIERVAGERALWLVGSATSKAGLWDVVVDKQPKVLLIDELSTMNAADTAALLSIMEGGRLVRAKKGRELGARVEIRVVAATNRLYNLSSELLSRFAVRKIEAYSRADYQTVVKGVLANRESVSPDLAQEIAQRLDGRSQDVRDAVRTARLAPQVGVEKAIRLLLG